MSLPAAAVGGDLRRGEMLLRHVADEFRISRRAYLRDIEPGDFDFGPNAVGADPPANQRKHHARHHHVPRDADDRRDGLREQLFERMASI